MTDDSYARRQFSVTAVAGFHGLDFAPEHACAGRADSFPRVSMAEPQWVAMCCYRSRDITWSRCTDCQSEYGCLGFGSSVEVLHFYELIPPTMLGAPLPLNLWPNLWKAIEPDTNTEGRGSTPVQLLVAALGLKYPTSPPQPQKPDG